MEQARGGKLAGSSRWSCWVSISRLPSHSTQVLLFPTRESLAPQGILVWAQPCLVGCGFTTVLPISVCSDASSPAPGKLGCSSSSSHSTWSSGDLAPPTRPVSLTARPALPAGFRAQPVLLQGSVGWVHPGPILPTAPCFPAQCVPRQQLHGHHVAEPMVQWS